MAKVSGNDEKLNSLIKEYDDLVNECRVAKISELNQEIGLRNDNIKKLEKKRHEGE